VAKPLRGDDEGGVVKPRILDLFSGIGGFSLAAHRCGFRTAAFSEVEPFPSGVLATRFPGAWNFGDVTRLEANSVGRVDVICSGFPCQDLSVAGKRRGLAGCRSGLFWEIVRLAGETGAAWLVLENVPGLLSSNDGRDMLTVVSALEELGYGVAWRTLDAQHFGVPQRRRRVFIVCCLGAPCPPEILFEPEGGARHPSQGRETGEIVAALTADGVGTCGPDDNQGQAGHLIGLTNRYGKGPDSDATEAIVYQTQGSNVGPLGTLTAGNGGVTGGVPFTTHALTAEGHDASEDGTGRCTPIVPFDTTQITSGENRSNPKPGDPSHPLAAGAHAPAIAFTERTRPKGRTLETMEEAAYALTNPASGGRTHSRQLYDGVGVRRLTPLECERLQGFPDGWTDIAGASDSARYRALGNAVAVPVVEWIMGRLMAFVETKVA
jgi:DNA (cytosine-5)-methyltransferase 1